MASVKICGQAIGCSLPQYLKVLLRRNFDFFFFFTFGFCMPNLSSKFSIKNTLFRCMFCVNERPSLLKQNIVARKTPGSP